ncbi:hypothetical protein LBMAG56_18120 [Verrucomicrobiota bacterium]|nr:hypothetical protein LBMAG56_18120 [Verrucomicrobiota bacterium]
MRAKDDDAEFGGVRRGRSEGEQGRETKQAEGRDDEMEWFHDGGGEALDSGKDGGLVVGEGKDFFRAGGGTSKRGRGL